MIVVMVTTEKGGVGKSSLSHALCVGASLVEDENFTVLLGHTDSREPAEYRNRPYSVVDMRDQATGIEILKNALAEKFPGIFVVDTGANQIDYTSILMSLVDMIVVPVVHDYDSVRLAVEAHNHFPEKTGYVLNQHPGTHSAEYKRYKRDVLSQIDQDKIVCKVPRVRAISELVAPFELDSYTRSRIRVPSIQLYTSIKSVFE